jgi:hypothetical protein
MCVCVGGGYCSIIDLKQEHFEWPF